MADHQESAYARLYQWVQDHCQDLEGDVPATSAVLQASMRALVDRPAYFE
jgi:hypothetical protein